MDQVNKMKKNIFVNDELQNKTEENKSYFYTIIGKQQFFDEDKNPLVHKENSEVFAKKVISNNKTKYYIKVGTYGKIYNPIGLFSEGTANKFLAKIGKKAWEFKEVNYKIFDMYVSFLRTKNIAWLNNAEREMI
jgi:hypothetical protein